MKYLFFDTEMATCKGGQYKMCEFGYVVTDEKFNIIKRGNIIIDPNIDRRDWDWYAVRKILTRKIDDYIGQPTFLAVYDDILEIFKGIDLVIGHTLDSDAKSLNDDCRRYELSPINFSFCDVKKIYRDYSNGKEDISLENLMQLLNVEGEGKLHDAEYDAVNTMLCFKALLKTMDKSLDKYLEEHPEQIDKSENLVVKSVKDKHQKEKQREMDKLHYTTNEDNKPSNLGDRFADVFAQLEKELDD